MGIEVSTNPPWVRVRFDGSATDEEFQRYLHEMTGALESWDPKFGRCVLINHVAGGFRSTAAQNGMHAQWKRDQQELVQRTLAGKAFVIPDPFVRSVTTSILRMNPQDVAYTVCATDSEAEQWGQRLLAGQLMHS